jgi:DNA polymerase I
MNTPGEMPFREIWLVDFEFSAPPGERSGPVCVVAWELKSGKKLQLWRDQLRAMSHPPYNIGSDSLFVAYYASAEFSCHLSLGWLLPVNVLDLYVEFRNMTNGLPTPSGNGLLGALVAFGLDCITAAEKDTMRNLVLGGGPWTQEEQAHILKYCESDVEASARLFSKMIPKLDVDRALLRGRYMKAVAKMEWAGVPVVTATWNLFVTHWEHIKACLIEALNPRYNIYNGSTFKIDQFSQYLISHNIPWPRLKSGRLDLSDETFKGMAQAYPEIAPLRELRMILSQMRLSDVTIGQDDRNRCLLSPFSSRSGRNQPSNTKFIFGPAVWLRGLIRPEPGYGLAYIDWSQQEFGAAAALSGDEKMMEAYNSGDPYLAFAKQAGAVPPNGTKQTHPNERELFKSCVLGTQYGMGAESLARRIRQPLIVGRELLRMHRETYSTFSKWSNLVQDSAILQGKLSTVFGWELHLSGNINPRSLRNFPMQANGAEMLRLACCFTTEQDIRVCAPIHDAILIEAPLEEIDHAVATTQAAMAKASSIVLDGFVLRSDATIVRYPDCYMDERGRAMWKTITEIVRKVEEGGGIPVID